MLDTIFKAKLKEADKWVYWNQFGEITNDKGKRTHLNITNGASTKYYYFIHQVTHLLDKDTVKRLG